MVSFKSLFVAATACVLAVQAVPTWDGPSGSIQAAPATTEDVVGQSSQLQKRANLREMQVHWADNGMITVLAGAYLSTQFLDAMKITQNNGVPGDALYKSLTSSIWSVGGRLSGAARGRLIRILNAVTLQKSIYWARTSYHSDFGFTLQLNPTNWNPADIKAVLDYIKQWASEAGVAMEDVFQSNQDYARDALANPFNPTKRHLQRRYACAADHDILAQQSAPMEAIPWSLYRSGDHCDLIKGPTCPAFPSCDALLKRSLVKRALAAMGNESFVEAE